MWPTELAVLSLVLGQATIPTEAEVRAEARRALEPLCRGRCDVIGVEIRTRAAEPRGVVAPGFEDLPAGPRAVSEIRLTVLFDQNLGAAFRSFATERLEERIGELGGPVRVTPKVRPFPVPAEPLEPPRAPPPPALAPPPPAEDGRAREGLREANGRGHEDLRDAWVDLAVLRAVEMLPILLLFGLLAWLVLRLLRRMEDLVFDLRAPQELPSRPVTSEGVEVAGAPLARPLPPPTIEELGEALQRHRSSTRRVFRRLLLSGEHDAVARAVALLGDGVVRDLAHDPEVRVALGDAGRRTAEILRGPMTDEERDELLRLIQAELVADRVAHRAEDVRPELEPLLGWSPETFVRFVEDLEDRRLAQVVLRHAPSHLMEAYLRGLEDTDRAELVRDLLESPPGTPEEIDALADRVEARSVAAEVGGWESDHVVDLLDALPADAQDRLVARLELARPDFVRRNAGRLPLESALLRVPDAALAAAWAKVPLDAWISYLRVAPGAVRARALEACPPRLEPAVKEELSLRVGVDADTARAVRKQIVRAALAAAAGARPRSWPSLAEGTPSAEGSRA